MRWLGGDYCLILNHFKKKNREGPTDIPTLVSLTQNDVISRDPQPQGPTNEPPRSKLRVSIDHYDVTRIRHPRMF
jgi:hypothetical protein